MTIIDPTTKPRMTLERVYELAYSPTPKQQEQLDREAAARQAEEEAAARRAAAGETPC